MIQNPCLVAHESVGMSIRGMVKQKMYDNDEQYSRVQKLASPMGTKLDKLSIKLEEDELINLEWSRRTTKLAKIYFNSLPKENPITAPSGTRA